MAECELTDQDGLLLVNAANEDVTTTLAGAQIVGQIFYIKRIDSSANIATVDPSPLLVGGLSSVSLQPLDAMALVTDGTRWIRL